MSEDNNEGNEVNEDSLLPDNNNELGDGEFFMSEGVKGIGDIPDWYQPDHFKSVSEQAKSYSELQKKFGSFTGTPKDGYANIEGVEGDDALYESLTAFGSEHQMSQKGLEAAWELLSAQDSATTQNNMEAELGKLGDNAQGRIKSVESFLKNNLDGDDYESLRYAVNSADVVMLVEKLIGSTAPKKLPIDGGDNPQGLTWEAIEKEMFKKDDNGNLLRSVNKNHAVKIQNMMDEFGGNKPHVQTVG